jgi:hypothetical protein
MTQEEIINRILLEIQHKSILSTKDYTPTTDHYIPVRFFKYYMQLAYAAGYDQGRKLCCNQKQVEQIKDGKVIKIWSSQSEASRAVGADNKTINRAVKGKIKTCKGFQWREHKSIV